MKLSSKEKIKQAFIELLETKGLDNVTITDITRKAKINRGTFYLSYADKYELLYTLENEIIESVLENLEVCYSKHQIHQFEDVVSRINTYKQLTTTILEIILREKILIRALISSKGDPSFVTQFQNEVFRTLFSADFFHTNNYELFAKMPPDYLEAIMLNGLTTVIIHWLSKDCEEPIEEIAHILNFTNFAAPVTRNQSVLLKNETTID